MKNDNFAIIYRDMDDLEFFVYINKTITPDEEESGKISLVKRYENLTMDQAKVIEEEATDFKGPKDKLIMKIDDILARKQHY